MATSSTPVRIKERRERLEASLEATRARAEELATQQADEERLEHLDGV